MNIPPIEFERRRIISRERETREMSAFEYVRGTIELWMDGELIKSICYVSKPSRTNTLKQWDMMMKNFYNRHVFWITLKPYIKQQ